MQKEFCRRCGLCIPKERIGKSNFCSELCNLIPSNFNNAEATIYRDGYNKCLENPNLLN